MQRNAGNGFQEGGKTRPINSPDNGSASERGGFFLFSWATCIPLLLAIILIVYGWRSIASFVQTENASRELSNGATLATAYQLLVARPDLFMDCSQETPFTSLERTRLCLGKSGLYAEIVDEAGNNLWRSPSSLWQLEDGKKEQFPFPPTVKLRDMSENRIMIEDQLFVFLEYKVSDEKACGAVEREVAKCFVRMFSVPQVITSLETLWDVGYYFVRWFTGRAADLNAERSLIPLLKDLGILVGTFLATGFTVSLVILVPLRRLYRDVEHVLDDRAGMVNLAGYPSEIRHLIGRILNLVQREREERERLRLQELQDEAIILDRIALMRIDLHDINKPLIGVIDGLEQLQRKLNTGDRKSVSISQDELSDYIAVHQTIVKVVKRCLATGAELRQSALELIRDRYATEKNYAPVIDIVEVAREITYSIPLGQREVEDGKIEITFKTECSTNVELKMDDRHLRSMLENLVYNACKYTKSSIFVKVLVTETEVVVAVEDNGAGVPGIVR